MHSTKNKKNYPVDKKVRLTVFPTRENETGPFIVGWNKVYA